MPLSLQVLLPSQNPVLGEGTGENKCCILKRFLTNENHKRELVPEISSSASLTQLSLDRGTVLHTVLGEPDTGMQAAASLRALQPPPSGMKPPRVITPQGPPPTPVRPPVLRTPLPVSYLEEEPLERLVLGRGMWPPIPRASGLPR